MKTKSKTIINKTPKELASSLNLSPSDAAEWEVRYSVSQKIINTFEKSSLTITELAKLSGTSRARITKVLKENSVGISLDVLFRILGATGYKVKLSYVKAA